MSRKAGAFSAHTRDLVYARSRGRCDVCGSQTAAGQYHHRKPRRMGGTSDSSLGTPANALYLHHGCHERIESNREWAYRNGYLVAAPDNPLDVAVRLWDGWQRLGEDGTLVPASPGLAEAVRGEAPASA